MGVSDRICKEYSRRTGKKVHKILPIIPFQHLNDIATNNKSFDSHNIFLVVGSLKPLKNPDIVIKALCFLGVDYLSKYNKRL